MLRKAPESKPKQKFYYITIKSIETPNRAKTARAVQDSEVTFSGPRLIGGLGRDEIVGQIELAVGHREWRSRERRSKERRKKRRRRLVAKSPMRPKLKRLENGDGESNRDRF